MAGVNPVMFLIVVAGAILAGTDNLTTWWGIAIIAALGIVAFLESLSSEDVSQEDALTDAIFIVPARSRACSSAKL